VGVEKELYLADRPTDRRVDIDSTDSFDMRTFHATLRLISVG